MIGNAKNINEILKSSKVRVKKHLGQNFLVDQNIIQKICEASGIDENTFVIEIGPGLGSLTELLCQKAKKVVAYEIDSEIIPVLKTNLANYSNLVIENKDVLKINIDEEIAKHFDSSKVVVVGNLPYYITTPIIMKFLEEAKMVQKLVFMMQLEVAERVTSKPNVKDYNSLSIAIQYQATAKIAFKVKETVFVPKPNVESAVVVFEIKEPDIVPDNEELFYRLVKASFSQRRKTLVNNILNNFDLTKDQIFEVLDEVGLSNNIRAESLDISDFIKLSNKIGVKYED